MLLRLNHLIFPQFRADALTLATGCVTQSLPERALIDQKGVFAEAHREARRQLHLLGKVDRLQIEVILGHELVFGAGVQLRFASLLPLVCALERLLLEQLDLLLVQLFEVGRVRLLLVESELVVVDQALVLLPHFHAPASQLFQVYFQICVPDFEEFRVVHGQFGPRSLLVVRVESPRRLRISRFYFVDGEADSGRLWAESGFGLGLGNSIILF